MPTLPEDDMRFSDKELTDLRKDFDIYKIEQQVRWDALRVMIEKNTEATAQLAKSTEGVIQLYSDIQGTVRVGSGFQKACLWFAKWGAICAALVAAVTYLVDKFSPPPPGP